MARKTSVSAQRILKLRTAGVPGHIQKIRLKNAGGPFPPREGPRRYKHYRNSHKARVNLFFTSASCFVAQGLLPFCRNCRRFRGTCVFTPFCLPVPVYNGGTLYDMRAAVGPRASSDQSGRQTCARVDGTGWGSLVKLKDSFLFWRTKWLSLNAWKGKTSMHGY